MSIKNYLPSPSVALWGVFIASLTMISILGGIGGIKGSIGGLLLQFIGTVYWGIRVRRKPSFIGGFWVDDMSPEWEKIYLGGLALVALIAGILVVAWELLHLWQFGENPL